MTRPIGIDMASGRIVMEGERCEGWLCVRGVAELATEDGQGPGRIFAEYAVRPSTGSRAHDPLAYTKAAVWGRVVQSRRVGRRPLP